MADSRRPKRFDPVSGDDLQDRVLGLSRKITRHDFLNSTLLASGAAALLANPPCSLLAEEDWTGYGGLGDYASSNGNTHEVMSAGHTIRDHTFEATLRTAQDTGELFDCLVIGGGISGLAAGLFFSRDPKAKGRTCLILENHPVFGGEAKRNEFRVNGVPVISHQGSAMFFPPLAGSFLQSFYQSVGIDYRQFEYQKWQGSQAEMPLSNTPYFEGGRNSAFYFGAKFGRPEGVWLVDPWGRALADAPISSQARNEWLKTRIPASSFTPPKEHGDPISRAMDAITLEEHLCRIHGISPQTVRTFLSPIAGGGSGLGADALSGYSDIAADVLFPWQYDLKAQMFPGGNTGVARHIVKALIPPALPGPPTMQNVCQARIAFDQLDRPGNSNRIRLRSTVLSVRHTNPHTLQGPVEAVYLHQGKLLLVRGKSAIVAGGSWTAKHILRDLPASHQACYAEFHRAPCLMANVAVRNWRFLYKMGVSECQWFDGIGNYFAIRRTATLGGGASAINPDTPVVLTLKILFSQPGLPIQQQVRSGRAELLRTPYRVYERRIRQQFAEMFGRYGFDPRSDISAIILNRWGHAYLAPQPGFFFGRDGNPAPGDFLRQHPYGAITFANSDLAGIMDHRASIGEAQRAAAQTLAAL